MTPRNLLKKILTGLTIPQEYVCLESPKLTSPLSFFLLFGDQKFDVTNSHLFLGYKPLVIALTFKTSQPIYDIAKKENQISLGVEFSEGAASLNVASLSLKKKDERILGGYSVLFYEGIQGHHYFLNSVHQWINSQRDKRRKQTPNNVGLPGNLADQVRIAYSLPRKISVITLGDGKFMNMFPTDLHGPVGETFYIGSLRTGGLANQQVELLGQIVISDVQSQFYKEAYTLGKNHMKGLAAETTFSLHQSRSEKFSFPLPVAVTRYNELKRTGSIDIGIHRIHLYEIVFSYVVDDSKPPLSHVHQYYAQWRRNKKLHTPMLLR